jgi:hypothetical protein
VSLSLVCQYLYAILIGLGTAAAIDTAATAAAPPPHRRTAVGAFVGGLCVALRGGRLLDRICLVFGLMCSFLVRWPRTVDAASGGVVFRRVSVRSCVTSCV